MDEFESESRRREWTPPNGTQRRGHNRVARKRVKRSWMRGIADALHELLIGPVRIDGKFVDEHEDPGDDA